MPLVSQQPDIPKADTGTVKSLQFKNSGGLYFIMHAGHKYACLVLNESSCKKASDETLLATGKEHVQTGRDHCHFH